MCLLQPFCRSCLITKAWMADLFFHLIVRSVAAKRPTSPSPPVGLLGLQGVKLASAWLQAGICSEIRVYLGQLRPSGWSLRGQIKDLSHSQVYLGTQGLHSPFHRTPVLQIAANQSGVKHFYLFIPYLRVGECFVLFFIVPIEASPQVVLPLRLKDNQVLCELVFP